MILSGDFNGDGKPDIATISPNAGGAWQDWLALELSTGDSFISKVWPANTPTHMRNGGASSTYQVLAGDFNGDGKTDVVTVSPNATGGWDSWLTVELSTGVGFTSERWSTRLPQDMRNGGANARYQTFAVDVNHDGKTDLVTLSANATGGWEDWIEVQISTGTAFQAQTWESRTPIHMRDGGKDSDYRAVWGRYDDDALPDLAIISPNAGGSWSGWVTLDQSKGSSFLSTHWDAATPHHMRDGLAN